MRASEAGLCSGKGLRADHGAGMEGNLSCGDKIP